MAGSVLPEGSEMGAGRRFQSTGFTAAAYTRINSWSGPGLGVSTVCIWKEAASAPVCTMACIVAGADQAAGRASDRAETHRAARFRVMVEKHSPGVCKECLTSCRCFFTFLSKRRGRESHVVPRED